MNRIADLLTLTKARITATVTLSTATGYILFAGRRIDLDLAWAALGVFLLACGASALNQIQEAKIDAAMPRTRNRPIPSGRMDRAQALFVAILLILLAFVSLATVSRHMPEILALGGFALLWYNLVYTYLKRITVFAVVPGALVGAIPPVMGWAAAGGVITDHQILAVGAFFFIWQIPHFWLLLLFRGEEYERAGLPSLTRIFAPNQLRRLTSMWVLATASAGIAIGAFAGLGAPWRACLLLASIWLASRAIRLLGPAPSPRPLRGTFIQLILYAVVVMASLSLDAVA